MFFLGITSSLIPYMLLTGVILIFTFETNKEILAESAKLPVSKSIKLETQHNVNERLTDCYLFTFKETQKESQQISNSTNTANTANTNIRRLINKRSTCQFIYLQHSSEYNALYFGLSPPTSIA